MCIRDSDFSIDDGFNLLKLHVKEAENDGALLYIASTSVSYTHLDVYKRQVRMNGWP